MKVIGIIAEYNPFHKGHAYQIEKIKKETHADYVVIAMSGNFMQRGAPALMDKYSRTHMALNCGADLVLELPVLYATASAEYFAKGGVSLLNGTNVVTHLCFGTEHDNYGLLQEIASILLLQPDSFTNTLRQELKRGVSFPAARFSALKSCFPKEKISPGQLEEILSSPNNILAIEYLKALLYYDSRIIPAPLLRKGSGYHDTSMENCFCSASAIRSILKQDAHNLNTTAAVDRLADTMPGPAYHIIKKYPHPFLYEDDFSTLLHYKLLTEPPALLSGYADSSPDLAARIKKKLSDFTSWDSFCEQLKTKNITYTRLSRLFLHIILDIHQEMYGIFQKPSYLRVLGFCKTSAPLLSAIKSQSALPLITSPADASKTLSDSGKSLLDLDLKASELYRLGLVSKGGHTLKNDYRQSVIRL